MKVYVTSYWESDEYLLSTIKKHAFGKSTWKNLEFTIKPGFDKVVVLNRCNSESLPFTADQAIVFRLEPPGSSNYTLKADSFIVPGFMHWPFLHMFPKENLYRIFQPDILKKKHLLSTVTSDLAYMEGHIERLIFIHYLDQVFLDGFDIWGRNTANNFFPNLQSYRGELTDKFDGLLDYEYHLAIENSFLENYFTEKLTDPILAECFCFYSGCTNIGEYIDERAFLKLDLTNKEEAKEMIVKAIADDLRTKKLKYIKQQKKRLLTDLNPLNLMWLALNEFDYENKIKL